MKAFSHTGDTTVRLATPVPRSPKVTLRSVLVTGVGGIVGQGVLKCLADARCHLVGVDASDTAVGLYAASAGYRVPRGADPHYVDRLLEICAAEGVTHLFPGLDLELPILSRAAGRFREVGAVVIVSSPAVVDIGDDKLETARFLAEHGFPSPRTAALSDGLPSDMSCPLVLKPQKGGSRSRGVVVVRTDAELRRQLETVDVRNYVAQEYIEGEEYTCGTLTFDGVCHGVIVMKRELRDGDTHKAFVVRDARIEDCVRSVAQTLRPFGPCNFQLRLRDNEPTIFDINPRCSGTTYPRSLAGFNEPRAILDFLEFGTPPSFNIRPIAILRYWKELVVDGGEIEAMRQGGIIRSPGRRL